MATPAQLARFDSLLSTISTNTLDSKLALTQILGTMQTEAVANAEARRDTARLLALGSGSGGGSRSSINSTTAGIGAGIGSAAAGIGAGVGSAATGFGAAGLMGLAGLAIFANFDANAIKSNVTTLLSIADEVGGRVEILKEGGTFFLSMAGIGIGLAAFGIGQGLVGLGQWITDDKWTQTLRTNVVDLLSIADGIPGNASLLFEGATLGAALAGLGIGLASFGVGQTLTGLGQWMTDDTWATQVKSNVLTLLSISDGIGESLGNLAKGALFPVAMTGLAAGLAVFSVGQAATGLAQFITGDDWAQQVKDNVMTLFSISDVLGGAGNFIGESAVFLTAMTGIAAGLALFGTGSSINGIAELITKDSWAQKIKDDVNTLMSIEDSLGGKLATFGEAGTFLSAMTGIGAGLAVFGTGSTITGLAAVINDNNWATKVKEDVLSLLSIGDALPSDETFVGESSKFFLAMSGIAAGLTAFAGGQFVGTLANAITGVLSFFTGAQNPFDQLMLLADNANKLIIGASALEKITNSLNAFSDIKISSIDIDFEKLATELGKAVPFLDALANGGDVKGSDGWLSGPINFPKGLLNPSLRLDEMAGAISKVNYILGQTSTNPTVTTSTATLTAPSSTVQTVTITAGSVIVSGQNVVSPSSGSSAPVVVNNNNYQSIQNRDRQGGSVSSAASGGFGSR